MSRPACGDCVYFDASALPQGYGHCRRYAPTPGNAGAWPRVASKHWCGEMTVGEWRPLTLHLCPVCEAEAEAALKVSFVSDGPGSAH